MGLTQIALVRERERGIRECTSGRKNRPEVPCDTPVCRIDGPRLILRCRNCGTDHVFEARDGVIVLVESRARTHALPQRRPIR